MEPPLDPRAPLGDGGFSTRAVHAPVAPTTEQAPVSPPIHPSATWAVDASADLAALLADERDGYVYGRYDNPTNTALHAQIAALHGTEAAWSFASGTAAIHATTEVLRYRDGMPGRILATNRLYGGTFALFERLAARAGWEVDRADLTDLAAVKETLTSQHTLLYAETIANPMTTVADLAALAEICAAADVAFVVDNTFASPYLCQPVALGATCAVESATKHLGGHGDVVAGVLAGTRELIQRVRQTTYETGASLGPFEAWLVQRGAQTLPLRMRQASASALAAAEHLAADTRVRAVAYPGLDRHPQHAIATRMFGGRGFGAVLSADLGDASVAERFADACRLLRRAASLGGSHSLVIHPASTTHRQLDAASLDAAGIRPGHVRLAIGIEDTEDLLADIRQALDVAYRDAGPVAAKEQR